MPQLRSSINANEIAGKTIAQDVNNKWVVQNVGLSTTSVELTT